VSLVNLSATRSQIDNLCVANITITGNITANDLNLSTGNLVPGANITVENNVISAYLSSDSQANLNSLQVDTTLDVFGVLNVSQTSNFQDSLNVSNNLYVGKSGQHAGDIVLYSGVVGNNFVQSFNSSGYEVNISATGNSSAINFFVGNQPCLEIRNNGIETLNLKADDINGETLNVVELEADVFQCIDGEATFRFTTPLLNATTANISTLTIDELDLDELDISTINASNGNFSTAFANQLNASSCILTTIAANEITTQNIESTNITATSNFATPSANVSLINSSISRSRSVNTFSFNLSDQTSSAQSMTMNRDGGTVTIVNNAGSIVFETNTNSTNRALIMDSNNLIQTRTIQNAGLFESRNISTDENISVGGSLSVGGSIEGYQETLVAGTNISIVGNTISSTPPSNVNFSTITSQTTNTSFLNTSFITCDELDADQIYTINLSSSAFDTDSITTGTITSFQYNISDTADDTEASFLFRNGATTRFIHTGGRLRFECDELQTSGVANFSTLNASIVNGANLSTATMVFTSDFNLQSFGNVLSLTKPLLSVNEVVAGLASKDVVTKSLNTSSLNVDGITSLDLVSVSIGLSSTNNNLFNINCGGTANISQGNFSSINSSNIVGYQETLIAGTNITIVGNTISTSDDANFSSINAEFINSSNVVNVSEIIGSNCDFGSGYIQSFKSELINASNMNLSNKLNASVVNASQINASNLSTGSMNFGNDFTFDTFSNTLSLTTTPQEAIAEIETNGLVTSSVNTSQLNVDGLSSFDVVAISLGLNSLVGNINTINSSGSANISVGNFSTLNASTINTSGDVSAGGIITAPNQIGVLAYSKSGDTVAGNNVTKLPYEETEYNIGGHYNTSTYVFTCPVAGRYYVYASYYTVDNQGGTVDLILDDGSSTRIISRSQEGSNAPGNNQKRQMSVIIDCSVGDELYARMANAQIRLRQNTTSTDEILNPFVVQFLG